MTIVKKINFFWGAVLIVTTISIIYSGIAIINNMAYQNTTTIMSLQIENIAKKVQASYNTLSKAGILEIEDYANTAKQELINDFRKFTFGKTGRLFIITNDKKAVFIQGIERGEIFNNEFVNKMLTKKRGDIKFLYEGVPRFCIFETFPEWNWLIALSITEDELFEKRSVYVKTAIVLALMILVPGVGLGFLLTKRITIHLRELSARVTTIAKKAADLTQQIEVKTNDELGQLAQAHNELIKSLRDIIKQVRDTGLKIASHVNQIQSGAEEQASGATEQSSTVTEVSATVEELATTASRIADSARNVVEATERTLAGIQEINTKVNLTAKKILSLGEKSQSIGNITSLIDDIAEETNLLALNAAIEAARAGEAGRGFAVVAQEVRKLAERSSESTDEIRQLISEIQSETNATIMGIEDSTKWVAKGLEMMKETAQSAKEISLATQQQKSASEQVTQAMQNIDSVTKQSVNSTEQAAVGTMELQTLSKELENILSGFKINEGEK